MIATRSTIIELDVI